MIARVNEAGVAESRVINSLSTKGIPIYRALGEAMGVTTQEAKRMAKEGTISAATFEKALQSLGKTVKGTSQALSSMTLEGAQNSFDAAESLAYASATEAADRSRIEMLNRLTDETMEEVENIALQQLRAAAGHGTQAVKNAAFEAWDGIGDFFTDLFGSAMVYLGGHSAASSSLNREINKKVDEMQDVTDEMAADAISKQIEALENYNKQLRDKMSFEVLGIDFMLDSTRAELEKTTRAIDNLIQERIRLHREAVEREQAQREVDAERIKKEFDAIPERLERERNSNIAQKQREMDRTLWERILNSDNFEGEGGRIAAGMAAQGILSTILPGINLDNAEEKMDELYQSIYESPLELGTLLDDVEAVREVMKRYQEVLEDITRKEQERAEQLRQEARERQRTQLEFSAAMGDKSASGELMLYDRANQINDNKYLTDLEKEWWIEEEANRLLREMQATTQKGVHLGNGIYGTKELPDNTASKGWVHNAWGAACRSFYNYEKNYDKEQYDELRKNTTANQETARGIMNLAQRFGITAQ
jgi:tape measure domain-containing protein